MKPERARAALAGALAGYGLLLLAVNLGFAPYPQDNDLDDVGWIAAHQSLGRLESLANQNYPFGHPLVLRLLTPLCGSLLAAALVCSTICATASVYLVYRITRRLAENGTGTAAAAAAAAAIAAAILL
ncbi:MAG TPA: glycosyltransferase family 39 protein, partial [Planctomycetota bacterium]|nr:glycosyltransferase family 39 protein [Planctomycetota bacterium]